MINVTELAQFLNDNLKIDRKALHKLFFENRIECTNSFLGDHSEMVVHSEGGKDYIGCLGVLNGILQHENNPERLRAVFNLVCAVHHGPQEGVIGDPCEVCSAPLECSEVLFFEPCKP